MERLNAIEKKTYESVVIFQFQTKMRQMCSALVLMEVISDCFCLNKRFIRGSCGKTSEINRFSLMCTFVNAFVIFTLCISSFIYSICLFSSFNLFNSDLLYHLGDEIDILCCLLKTNIIQWNSFQLCWLAFFSTHSYLSAYVNFIMNLDVL